MENDVPYIAFEGIMARHERHMKRLIITLVIAIILIFASKQGMFKC